MRRLDTLHSNVLSRSESGESKPREAQPASGGGAEARASGGAAARVDQQSGNGTCTRGTERTEG